MADLMDEISDDLRQQKLKEFWAENGAWIIGGAILAVFMTGAMTFWRDHTRTVNMRETGALISTLNAGTVESLEKYAVESGDTHGAIARFMAAGIEIQRHEPEKAALIYDEIAKMNGVDGIFKDLARLLGVNQRLSSGDPARLHKTLDDLTGKKEPWRYSALELKALLFAREGKTAEAAGVLAEISASADAPADVRTRAVTLRELYLAGATTKAGE